MFHDNYWDIGMTKLVNMKQRQTLTKQKHYTDQTL